ncbi:hypothetical protein XELAEV_18000198mg [Xenopus laevis]|uniref:Uncharacterized protein n=1 Tax=Xenopus laevis TaxID=8355 RepID=A0A974GYM2_XENLA|nr:hypothetical protein XELAEV_18000198mg [Xenopus laevis]
MSFADIAATTDRKADIYCFTEVERKRILQASQSLPQVTISAEPDLFRNLEQLKRRETVWALHSASLTEYVRAQRIPRGLRISLQPALFRGDAEFLTKWRGILNRCSLDLMTLTIQQLNNGQKELQQQIHAASEEYKIKFGATNNDTLQELERKIEKLQQELLQGKLRKFRRDTRDYETGEVYTWKDNRRAYRQRFHSSASTSRKSETHSTDSEASSPVSSQGSAVAFLGQGRQGGQEGQGGARGRGTYRKSRAGRPYRR